MLFARALEGMHGNIYNESFLWKIVSLKVTLDRYSNRVTFCIRRETRCGGKIEWNKIRKEKV